MFISNTSNNKIKEAFSRAQLQINKPKTLGRKMQVDTVHISAEGKKLSKQYITTATKGLYITSNNTTNYKVTFDNSAYVYRAIDKGSIDINGKTVLLNDEIKNRLREIAKRVDEMMEQEFLMTHALNNMEVLQDQAETINKQAINDAKIMEIARRIMRGEKVPASDERKLAEYNPKLYQMAKQAAMLAKPHKKYKALFKDEEESSLDKNMDDSINDNPYSQLSTYSVQMDIGTTDDGGYTVEGVSFSQSN